MARVALVLALDLAGSFANPAAAQQQDPDAVSTYRLPDPTRTATPRAQGPVDSDNPVARPSPAPIVTPDPAPAPAPRITLPPVPPATPAPTQPAPDRQRPAASVPTPAERTENAQATPGPSPRSTDVAPAPSVTTSPPPSEPTLQPSPTQTPSGVAPATPARTNWLIPSIIAAGLLGLVAFLLLRRRRNDPIAEDEPFFEPAPVPDPKPTPPARSDDTPPVLPKQEPSSVPAAFVVEPLAIAMLFMAKAIRLSLVYATVQYELEITNAGSTELADMQVRADLASAHASLGTREQLAPAPEQLESKHTLFTLTPGETTMLKGEVRVPLQHVRTVSKGTAQFFVPLVRFVIIAPDGSGLRRVYTTGPRDQGSGAIASVRLDAGPRNLRDLDAREIEAARGFSLDPEIAHS